MCIPSSPLLADHGVNVIQNVGLCLFGWVSGTPTQKERSLQDHGVQIVWISEMPGIFHKRHTLQNTLSLLDWQDLRSFLACLLRR